MVKIENLSTVCLSLQFEDSARTYSKHLHANAVIKLTEEEFSKLVEPPQSALECLKISKYNIVGSVKGKVELINPTSGRIIVQFQSPNNKNNYSKVMTGNSSLLLSESDYKCAYNLDPRIQVNRGGEHKIFFAATIRDQPILEDAIPEASPLVEEDKKESVSDYLTDIEEKVVEDVGSYKKKKKKNGVK